jgi:Ca2+-binding EF-hand superfamily protein
MASGTPIWSGSMRQANLLLLFVTLPPFFIASANASATLLNLGAIVMTLGLLPIIAGSVNLLFTACGNTSAIVKNPGALAATLAMVLMPFYAVGAFFTGMDVFVGTGQLGEMATTLDMGFLWTVGGLMILSGAYTSYPLACKKDLCEPSKANLTVWFVLFGGFASTITNLLGDFTTQAVTNSGVEDAIAQTGGFYLVGAALFYFTAIGAILATLVVIRTSASQLTSSNAQTSVSDIDTYNLGDGTTTIRTLLGRGVGIDTTLVVGKMEEDEGGSTIIAVSAALHNDEVTEFPEAEEEVEEVEEAEPEGVAKELVMLAEYLANSGQSIFQFFKSIDLDDSGKIDTYEFQMALKNTEIANLPPWEMDSLVAAIDIDNDGQINLPELDIAIAKVRKAISTEEADSAVEVPSKAQLNKMKKAELVELATSLDLDASGTKKDLISLISEA